MAHRAGRQHHAQGRAAEHEAVSRDGRFVPESCGGCFSNLNSARQHFDRCHKHEVAAVMAGLAMAHLVASKEGETRLNPARESRRALARLSAPIDYKRMKMMKMKRQIS